RFLRLAGFLGAAAGTEEEQAKNFQWGLRSDQTSGRRVVIGISRPLSRVVTRITVIITTVMDQTGEVVVTTTAVATTTTNYSGSNNRSSGNGRDQRNRGQQSNRYANSGSQQSRGPFEGYSYPVCTTCGRRHPGECLRATGTCFKCSQAGHLQKDCKKNTTASTS
nr:zinc finger, CCHC-type, retrotransposon Gag domain protein [Tanacetum cinerariifolium]